MSSELEVCANSLTDGLVPEMWAKVAYPSLKPLGSWVVDLVQRLSFFKAWFEEGPSHPRPFHARFSSQFPGTCLGVSSKSGALNGGCSPRLVCKAHAAAV